MTNDAIVWISELPAFAIYAAVAGLAGILGTLIGHVFSRWFKIDYRVIFLIFLVGSIQITQLVIIPSLGKMAFKAGFMEAAGEMPRQMDEWTILESVGIYNDAVNYNYRLIQDIADIDEAKSILSENLRTQSGCDQLIGSQNDYYSKMIFRYETNLGVIEIDLIAEGCTQ